MSEIRLASCHCRTLLPIWPKQRDYTFIFGCSVPQASDCSFGQAPPFNPQRPTCLCKVKQLKGRLIQHDQAAQKRLLLNLRWTGSGALTEPAVRCELLRLAGISDSESPLQLKCSSASGQEQIYFQIQFPYFSANKIPDIFTPAYYNKAHAPNPDQWHADAALSHF